MSLGALGATAHQHSPLAQFDHNPKNRTSALTWVNRRTSERGRRCSSCSLIAEYQASIDRVWLF